MGLEFWLWVAGIYFFGLFCWVAICTVRDWIRGDVFRRSFWNVFYFLQNTWIMVRLELFWPLTFASVAGLLITEKLP